MTPAEVKATAAYYNTLLNELKDDHDEQIKNLQAAHLEEIVNLNTEWEKQKATHAGEVASLKAEWDQQKKTHVGTIMTLRSQLEKAGAIASQKEKEIFEAGEAAKYHEIALLKRKIVIEVKFRCKGGRTRTHLLRRHARFKEAVAEFCKDVGKEVDQLRFYVSDRPMDGLPKAEWDSTPAVRQLVPGLKTLQGVR